VGWRNRLAAGAGRARNRQEPLVSAHEAQWLLLAFAVVIAALMWCGR